MSLPDSENLPGWKWILHYCIDRLVTNWPNPESYFHPVKLLRLFPRKIVVERENAQFYVDPSEVVQYNIFKETHDTEFFKQRISGGDIVFDLGANCGFYSVIAGNIVGPDGAVFVFEPSEKNYRNLIDNILLNDFSHVRSYHLGIADFDGNAPFYLNPGGNSGRPSISSEVTGRRYKISVPFTTLDAFVEEHDIPRIDFMKVDVQGAEYKVLQGAKSLRKQKRIQNMYLELHRDQLNDLGASYESCLNLLDEYGSVRMFEDGAVQDRTPAPADLEKIGIAVLWETE